MNSWNCLLPRFENGGTVHDDVGGERGLDRRSLRRYDGADAQEVVAAHFADPDVRQRARADVVADSGARSGRPGQNGARPAAYGQRQSLLAVSVPVHGDEAQASLSCLWTGNFIPTIAIGF